MLISLACPATNDRTPRYMEKALSAIHQGLSPGEEVLLSYTVVQSQVSLAVELDHAIASRVIGPILANYPQAACTPVVARELTRPSPPRSVRTETGIHRVSPDCHVQVSAGGRVFNILFEIDRSTEPLDSSAANSIRTKLLAYEAYQDYVLGLWKSGSRKGLRPYFRVAFLTVTVERAHHILSLAEDCATNRDRKLCYASTLDEFLAEADALRAPLFLDHHGYWHALVDLHPSSHFIRAPVRINRLQPMLPLG